MPRGSKRDPKMPPGSPKEHEKWPKGPQRRPKGPQRSPKGSPRVPMGAPSAPQGAQRAPKGALREPKRAPKVTPGHPWSSTLMKKNDNFILSKFDSRLAWEHQNGNPPGYCQVQSGMVSPPPDPHLIPEIFFESIMQRPPH